MVVIQNIFLFFFSIKIDQIKSLIVVESVGISFLIPFQFEDMITKEKNDKTLIEFNSVINDVLILFFRTRMRFYSVGNLLKTIHKY